MNVTLSELHGEMREYFNRVEEVLSGMDAMVARLQDRVSALEGNGGIDHTERLARLEGQLAALAAALSGDDEDGPGLYLGR